MTAIRPREVTDVTTGESLALVPADHAHEFSMQQYLGSIATPQALAAQQQLAAAYDAACHALVGPNDVQKEGGREFKKKSAWRKLGRHFRISTSVVRIDKEWTGDGNFLATVTVRASAPWGQSAESVGACGTDEATGRRTISTADAIATAETRATNRAVSNLIAMGEVSAEEMGNRSAPARDASRRGNDARVPVRATATVAAPAAEGDDVMCPKCGGRTWDNRTTKKNPRAPDYKCRDRNCDGCVWPPRDGEAPAPAPAAASVRPNHPFGDDFEAVSDREPGEDDLPW